ncbi:Eco57I restriction-modification methylase domain-containing protein [Candidatus Magnetominusculus xianensis]|uniref:site-specific DNA-methyltransferase (adenine-specific) n=1 Tax=Candidatus Magnetominusculus xianensis TaxID=1748249 RepID=A0ABR5SEF2_9BACT|nr:TaqI-like C-terminal specificity domain-containing protein [Candidatus Magnetominusculus xianensis]KWT84199.1 type II restriction endonuclease [Candidatus Magnetominusculus xianensis]MBF0405430.1 Eco57I restriction-modification methylase domain-containing protein [Nitrospirota bacterium]
MQPITQRNYAAKKRPDYALFKDSRSLKAAHAKKDNLKGFYSDSLTILEAKYWGRRLNDTDKGDNIDSRDPTAQTIKYLEDVHYHSGGLINWAFVTNGKLWRLFYYRASSKAGNYYEVDLEEIILNGGIESFLYFYLFFAKDALIEDPVTGKTWLEQHIKGSEDYAVRVSERLKDLIFDEVFELLAEGFIHFRKTVLSIVKETPDSRETIFKGCLTLLYRLLFLLYAESRSLLPMDNVHYRKISLSSIKEAVSDNVSTTGIAGMSKQRYGYWAGLDGLFEIVSKGDPGMNVPVYNGGLFEASKSGILKDHKIADPFIARALELLTTDYDRQLTSRFIDYSSLGVRHLGDIYEGLLEFRLQIADEDIAEVRENGKFLWRKVSLVKAEKIFKKKPKGEAYIENSKHERKSTGSYYTPHYIVQFIIEHAVAPVLNNKLKEAEAMLSELRQCKTALKKQRAAASLQWYRDKITALEEAAYTKLFDIKVLDPAMGSGHFLVHTVDFISDKIAAFLADYPENPVINKIHDQKIDIIAETVRQGVRVDEGRLTEVTLIKRLVMKRCIYGVDSNDMAVELAKLSLWLDCFTVGAPLSFIDHHLKCGNSLIGVQDISGVVLPNTNEFSKFQRALSFIIQVSELTDSTIDEAKRSYALFKDADDELAPIRRRFDVNTAKHFMDICEIVSRMEQLASTLNYEKEPFPEVVDACKKALQIAAVQRFFHWRLEFPEVFYSGRGEMDNPGFDCVIGNPPYINIMLIADEQIKYLKKTYKTARRRFDLYVLFCELAVTLLKRGGYHSFIVPDKVLSETYAASLREMFIKEYKVTNILNLNNIKVFHEAAVKPVIYVIENKQADVGNEISVETPLNEAMKDMDKASVCQYDFLKMPEFRIRFEWSEGIENIIDKVNRVSFPASRVLYVSWGAQPGIKNNFFYHGTAPKCNNPAGVCEASQCPQMMGNCKASIKGSSVGRYSVEYENSHILYDMKRLHRPAFPELFENEKIVVCEVTGEKGLIAAYDNLKYYTDHSLINCILKFHLKDVSAELQTGRGIQFVDYERNENEPNSGKTYDRDTIIYKDDLKASEQYSIKFILSLINSRLIGYYYIKYVSGQLNVFPEHIRKLPIFAVDFSTPVIVREDVLSETDKLYSNSNYGEILSMAVKELSISRSDTVHDILAFLAGEMFRLNTAQKKEEAGFLRWLELEIGAKINDLTGKTQLRQYHRYEFDVIIAVLRKNKNKIPVSLSRRDRLELLEDEFTKSKSIILPLKQKIDSMDILIDNIVYKLYGMTEDEIKIIEERCK